MSTASKKQPKPFLKRGTRQFLSNATVRSLNQKAMIVQFGEDYESDLHQTKPNSLTFGKQQEEEIKIEIKRSTTKEPNIRTSIGSDHKKPKQNKPLNQQKTSNALSASKKKPAQLQDYLGTSSFAHKKQPNKTNFSKDQNGPISKNSPPITTMTALLTKQQEQMMDGDQEDQELNTHYKPIQKNNDFGIKQKVNHNQSKIPPRQSNIIQKKEQISALEQAEQICFNSDSQDEVKIEKKPKQQVNTKGFSNHIKPATYPERKRWDADNQQENGCNEEQTKGPSKLLQKYYKKQGVKIEKPISEESMKNKLECKDIPNEIKEQIINEYLVSKKSEIEKKLEDLQVQSNKVKKEKQKYQEENKRLMKERQEFQKQTDEKSKQFEEKIKNQNSKLNREKKYMKDQQTSGKVDWKVKNQVEELKVKLQNSENEKKKLKTDFQREGDRLKKKIEEISKENQSLKQQMKYIEMQKIQIKQKSKQIEKKIETVKQINYWEGAPTTSYIYSLADNKFTLLDLQACFFNYQRLQHYQYYLSKKADELELEHQQSDANKITRRYKNGKEQIEYISKVLKENFPHPFKFAVVNHINGDIKLIFPSGIQIYYDYRNQITEFKISTQKTIYYFHRLSQIEMKFRHPQQGEIHQLRKGNSLIRHSLRGEERFRKNDNGLIEQLA